VLLAAAGLFCAYHLFSTVEVMGHHSRFYLPALIPLLGAAMSAWPDFVERMPKRTMWAVLLLWLGAFVLLKIADWHSGVFIYVPAPRQVPYLVAICLLFAAPQPHPAVALAAVGLLILGTVTPLRAPAWPRLERDETILYRQIAPRATFHGIVPLVELQPKNVYHTDVGAPGVLFADGKVTDLDGILNEELTFDRKPFEELCRRDRPDAIFFPNLAYPRLRAEIAGSACFKDYEAIPNTRLYVRRDRIAAYRAAATR
jgi:hypothetical protein